MRKIFYTIILLSALGTKTWAQSTAVAITDKTPANNAAELNANAAATAALGENGLVGLVSSLQPNGTADNTKTYDAISGFSFYVTQNSKEAWRAMAVKAYSKALAKITDKYNQQFIISQFQIVGKDDAVPTLSKYLNDNMLCDPAARALVKINSLSAKSALLMALKSSQGECRLSLVEALGDSRNSFAANGIGGLLGQDKKLDKVALYALANIANPRSSNLLAAAAEKAHFTYDETNATMAYITYIGNLNKKGMLATASTLAKTLGTKADLAGQVQTATAALKLQVEAKGASCTPLLIQAMQNNNAQYREAALKFAGPYLTPVTVPSWVRLMSATDPTRKAEITRMLGIKRAQGALPAILKELKNSDAGVVVAAVKASQQIGQDKALSDILAVLSTGNDDEIAAVQNALLVMKGTDVVDKVAKALPDAQPKAQVALISVLAARQAHNKIDIVMPLLNSTDASVRMAAYSSLKQLAGEDNLQQLFALMSKVTQKDETEQLQAAIIAVMGQMKDAKAQTGLVLQQMDAAPADRKPLYFGILASIGDKAALSAVSKAYDKGDVDTKKMAVTALSQWANISAVRELLHIGREATDPGLQNRTLSGVVTLIGKAKAPADEKVIFLRDAMEIARSADQKKLVLEELANDKTYVALIFAGKYLDDPALQTEASAAVVSIGLSNKDFYGNDVRVILNKVMGMRRGGDGDYEREAIKKFIAEMPTDAGYIDLFDNHDLTGWKGLVGNPVTRSKMDAATLAKEQHKADSVMRKGWYVKDSILNFSGEGENICTEKQYRNFDMYVDWKIESKGDAGIYLRGSPQVQIWDTSRVDVGAQVGSGGLYNNQAHESKPAKLADNAIGEWNSFHIIMKGDKVTVYLNGVLVVDNVVMDNYWDRSLPIFPKEQIELQAHGTHVYYRDVYLKELPE